MVKEGKDGHVGHLFSHTRRSQVVTVSSAVTSKLRGWRNSECYLCIFFRSSKRVVPAGLDSMQGSYVFLPTLHTSSRFSLAVVVTLVPTFTLAASSHNSSGAWGRWRRREGDEKSSRWPKRKVLTQQSGREA
ncbi:hypothetical protein E2C01_013123 [Portunus trituberculatus]|uniref:Uncharacterized protein n=1 Tax=Portunus trituberculatus TaxID=210409 RepID=A0A5B7DFG2_PORTR|nr:hypothetical protein [Portunus trituberculatus]